MNDQIIILLKAIHEELIFQRQSNSSQIKKDEWRNGIKIFYHKIGCDGDSILTKLGFTDKDEWIIYCPKCHKQQRVE